MEVTLDRNTKKKQMEAKLLLTLHQNPTASDDFLSKKLDTSVRNVQRSIQKMKQYGIVKIKTTKFQLGGNWVNVRNVEVTQ
jgi:biotin operon repressor